MEVTTITVSKDTLERFKELKRELDEVQDGPDHTAESFLEALLDTWEAAEDGYYGTREDTARQVVQELRDELGIEGDADVASRALDNSATPPGPEEIADAVARRMDYAEVASKTAENVVRELR